MKVYLQDDTEIMLKYVAYRLYKNVIIYLFVFVNKLIKTNRIFIFILFYNTYNNVALPELYICILPRQIFNQRHLMKIPYDSPLLCDFVLKSRTL